MAILCGKVCRSEWDFTRINGAHCSPMQITYFHIFAAWFGKCLQLHEKAGNYTRCPCRRKHFRPDLQSVYSFITVCFFVKQFIKIIVVSVANRKITWPSASFFPLLHIIFWCSYLARGIECGFHVVSSCAGCGVQQYLPLWVDWSKSGFCCVCKDFPAFIKIRPRGYSTLLPSFVENLCKFYSEVEVILVKAVWLQWCSRGSSEGVLQPFFIYKLFPTVFYRDSGIEAFMLSFAMKLFSRRSPRRLDQLCMSFTFPSVPPPLFLPLHNCPVQLAWWCLTHDAIAC